MSQSPLEPPVWTRKLKDYPTALAWSSDGQHLAVATDEGHVHLLERSTGQLAHELLPHKRSILAMAWHPKEALLATAAEDGAVCLSAPGRAPVTLRQPGDTWADQVAWSPNGQQLAVASGKNAWIFSNKGKLKHALPAVESTITGLGWDGSGKQLACACYGGVEMFWARTGKPSRQLKWKGSMLNLHWSPNDKVIACGCQDRSVHFWRTKNGLDSMMSGYPAKPTSLSWSADSRLLATNGGHEVMIWDFSPPGPENKAPILLEDHPALISAVAFAPSAPVLASADREGGVRIWAPDRQQAPICHFEMEGLVEAIAWTTGANKRDLWLACCDEEGTVAGWALGPQE